MVVPKIRLICWYTVHLLTTMTTLPSLLLLGSTNTLLSVEVDSASSSSSPTLQCQFQSRVTGTASCLVRYGRDPTYTDLPFQEQVMRNFTNGGTITVPLSNLHSQNLTLVYYVVLAQTGSQSVSMMGLFRTGEWYMGSVIRANYNYFKPSDKCQASLNSGLTFMIHGRTYMYL